MLARMSTPLRGGLGEIVLHEEKKEGAPVETAPRGSSTAAEEKGLRASERGEV